MSLKIYLIYRDGSDYDEYDAFVVVAGSESEALSYLEANHHRFEWPGKDAKTSKLIGTTDLYKETTEILGSFNAG